MVDRIGLQCVCEVPASSVKLGRRPTPYCTERPSPRTLRSPPCPVRPRGGWRSRRRDHETRPHRTRWPGGEAGSPSFAGLEEDPPGRRQKEPARLHRFSPTRGGVRVLAPPLTTESPTTHNCPTPSQQTRPSSRCHSVLCFSPLSPGVLLVHRALPESWRPAGGVDPNAPRHAFPRRDSASLELVR